jgi:hypothetical protein
LLLLWRVLLRLLLLLWLLLRLRLLLRWLVLLLHGVIPVIGIHFLFCCVYDLIRRKEERRSGNAQTCVFLVTG